MRVALAAVILFCGLLPAQPQTGIIEGVVHTSGGQVLGGAPIVITGPPGFRVVVHANSDGVFSVTLPYGRYQFSVQRDGPGPGVTVIVRSSQTMHVELIVDPPVAAGSGK